MRWKLVLLEIFNIFLLLKLIGYIITNIIVYRKENIIFNKNDDFSVIYFFISFLFLIFIPIIIEIVYIILNFKVLYNFYQKIKKIKSINDIEMTNQQMIECSSKINELNNSKISIIITNTETICNLPSKSNEDSLKEKDSNNSSSEDENVL